MFSNVGPVQNTVSSFHVVPSAPEQYGHQRGAVQNPIQKLLKGEPKALGTVQIMIGILTILFSVVSTFNFFAFSVLSGIVYWGSLCYIASGALSVASANHPQSCVVKGSLVMNIFSAVAAGIAIILLSLDLIVGLYAINCHYRHSDCVFYLGASHGICGVLLVFSVFEFVVSIITSALSCRVTCCSEPAVI